MAFWICIVHWHGGPTSSCPKHSDHCWAYCATPSPKHCGYSRTSNSNHNDNPHSTSNLAKPVINKHRYANIRFLVFWVVNVLIACFWVLTTQYEPEEAL